MAKHDPNIRTGFLEALQGADKMKESELQEAIRPTVLIIEKDDSYSTSKKLKIFSLMSSLSNCAEKERPKYVRKIAGALK
ncbi:MAG: hypothetical protein E7194_05030 [Erysipelotrichaceae bacterium]|nr:hypothetical protein [Erysipelotrichaceae bacterium]